MTISNVTGLFTFRRIAAGFLISCIICSCKGKDDKDDSEMSNKFSVFVFMHTSFDSRGMQTEESTDTIRILQRDINYQGREHAMEWSGFVPNETVTYDAKKGTIYILQRRFGPKHEFIVQEANGDLCQYGLPQTIDYDLSLKADWHRFPFSTTKGNTVVRWDYDTTMVRRSLRDPNV